MRGLGVRARHEVDLVTNPWVEARPRRRQDKEGDIAVGFTVSNGSSVFPDIRYTGRLKGDELNHLPRPPGPQARPEHARSDSDRLPLEGVGWLGAVGAHQDGQRPG
jgi:hypothetical protein